jgi:UDP-N-acetylglucosamine/UDP-N-acetylgalactosamine diphosphorylase
MKQVQFLVNNDEKSLYEYLKQFGQEHLLRFWNELNDSEKEQLYKDITNIDLPQVTKCFAKIKENFKDTSNILDSLMEPVSEELTGSYSKSSKDELKEYYHKGLEKVSANEVAVLLLAGGQGTRLGADYPKGMYSVSLASNKTLYQLQAERILRLETLAAKENNKESCVITWYIMTSEATKEETRNFFAKNNFFGLKSENVVFFEQYTLPCLTHEGKIILDSKFKLSKAPDGNGGLYRALLKQDILEDMAKREIKHIHVYCVDNVLVKIADPIFIGFCIEKNANCAAKVSLMGVVVELVGFY